MGMEKYSNFAVPHLWYSIKVDLMNNSVILKNLDLGYRSGSPVLSQVSSEFKEGGIYGLLGLNGAGKTTLFRGLSGLIRPLAGTIEAFGMNPFDKSREFLENLMFVPITPVLPAMTGKRFVRTYSSFWPGFSMEEFIETAQLLSVNLGKNLSRMSYGEQKKFMLSFALSTDTKLLLLDEPLAGLDMVSQKNLLMSIAQNQKPHRILIISSNQAEELDNVLTDVVIIFQGKILLNSSIERISSDLAFYNQGSHPNSIFVDGLKSISLNNYGDYTDVDLRMLFYAACSSNKFREILCAINNNQTNG